MPPSGVYWIKIFDLENNQNIFWLGSVYQEMDGNISSLKKTRLASSPSDLAFPDSFGKKQHLLVEESKQSHSRHLGKLTTSQSGDKHQQTPGNWKRLLTSNIIEKVGPRVGNNCKNLPGRDGEKYFIELKIFVMSSRVNVPVCLRFLCFYGK